MPTTPTSLTSPGPPDLLGKFSLLPRADIILRSCDSHDFPVQKLYVIDSSPVLGEQIFATTSHGVGTEPEGKPYPPYLLSKRDEIEMINRCYHVYWQRRNFTGITANHSASREPRDHLQSPHFLVPCTSCPSSNHRPDRRTPFRDSKVPNDHCLDSYPRLHFQA
jgi:hypothetical protein